MTDVVAFWRTSNWFAIQAKPSKENLAAAQVAKLDAEVFLPKAKQEQMIGGSLRFISKPLFAGYFFARFCPLLSLEAIRCAHGVLRVIGTTRLPIPLDAEIIVALRERVQPDGLVWLERNAFRPGDLVTVEQGSLCGWIGRVEGELDDGRRVTILLEAIQGARLLVEKRWLSLATSELA